MLLARSIFFTFLFPGTIAVLIPYLIMRPQENSAPPSLFRYFGLPLIVVGASGLLWCIWQFFSEGKGTLAPVDPPKKVVVRGLYRVVRNPMYVSVASILLGEAILFESLGILAEAALFILITHLFVVLYEEPHLKSQFGADYDLYRKNVGRWFPR